MRTVLDITSGMLIMIPDSDPDRELIGHLINCSDLTEFSTYLAVNKIDSREITADLGVPVKQIDQYTDQQHEPVEQNSSKTGQTVNLIGFNRSSY